MIEPQRTNLPQPRNARPQFSLRTLFLLVALVAGLCAVFISLRPLWSVLIVWFLVLVIAHVAGNTWSRWSRRQHDPQVDDAERPHSGITTYAPTSRLGHHVILGRAMFVSAAVSAVAGCVLGVVYLVNSQPGLTPSGLLVGAVSSAVLGGLFGFLTSSFLTVTMCAIHEACGGKKPKKGRSGDGDGV